MVATVSALRPGLAERRDAQVGPADEVADRAATEASTPALVARPANRTATPSATPSALRSARSGRARRLRQARRVRDMADGLQPELGEPGDQRRRVVRLAPAELDRLADPAVADDEDAVGVGRRLRVVGDEHDRLAALDARAPQRVEDLGAGRVVEVAGRLVGEQERRSGDERPGDGDALLLAGRELVGLVALLAGQVDERDDVADPLGQLAPGRVVAGDRERQRDVLGDVEQRDEVERLEDEAGPVAAQPGRLVVGELADAWPSRTTSPDVGRSRPPRTWRSVDLPEPDGPIRATNSPASTDSETPRSASTRLGRAGTTW